MDGGTGSGGIDSRGTMVDLYVGARDAMLILSSSFSL